MQKKQYVVCRQPTPTQNFDREEIAPGQDNHMRGEKLLPGSDLTSFLSGRNAVPTQDVLHRLV
jgi:hypothetical protein